MELFKLRVQNLGRIRDAELSIRPLTVFVGPNNTNKTWTAYALYGLAQWLSWPQGSGRYPSTSVVRHVEIDRTIKEAIDSKTSEFVASASAIADTGVFVDDVTRNELLGHVSYPVRLWLTSRALSQLLAAPRKHLKNSRVSLEMSQDQFLDAFWDRVSLRLRKGPPGRFESRLAGKARESAEDAVVRGSEPQRVATDYVKPAIAQLVLQRVGNVVALPAERKTLVLLYKLLMTRRRWKALSLPVANFARLLFDAEPTTDSDDSASSLGEVLALLYERILTGKLSYEAELGPITLTYAHEGGPSLRLQAAASLVRALAGLGVYLDRFAERGDLLIVDEPEMNAHPEAQLMITELLGVLVNSGISVVVTTHSPYVLEHVSNLAVAAGLPEAKQGQIASRFKLGTKEAFVPAEDVSAYLFNQDGHVEDVFDREEGDIDCSTFGRASDHVDNLFGDVLEAARRE